GFLALHEDGVCSRCERDDFAVADDDDLVDVLGYRGRGIKRCKERGRAGLDIGNAFERRRIGKNPDRIRREHRAYARCVLLRDQRRDLVDTGLDARGRRRDVERWSARLLSSTAGDEDSTEDYTGIGVAHDETPEGKEPQQYAGSHPDASGGTARPHYGT